jgi:AcrR family transcriptional regulator
LKTKEKILSLAISLFAKKGYNGVSMRELAQSSNLGVAGLYHYFPNKEVLYQQAIKQYFSNKALSCSGIWQTDIPAKDKLIRYKSSIPMRYIGHARPK